ncbi:MAG: PAS domain-containing protein [Calditrichaeota bacterium]|nr:PAS domain-containing protein [Calditrichota bacterium]MCB9474935.1 PAS domain-containing protein [Candidatus Delongbacteria bacterium]
MPEEKPTRLSGDACQKFTSPLSFLAALGILSGLLFLGETLEAMLATPGTTHASLMICLLCTGGVALAMAPVLWFFVHRPLQARQNRIGRMEKELELILRGTGVGVWDWNVQTGGLRINARWASILGYRPEELEPVSIQTWMRLANPEDLDASNRQLAEVFAGEREEYCLEARMRHRDGSEVWVLDQGRVTERDSGGRVLRMMGTHLDITERKRQEAALLELNKRLAHEQQVFSEGPVVAYTMRIAKDWPVKRVSPNVLAITGYPAEDFIEGKVLYEQLIHPDDRVRVLGEVDSALQSGSVIFDHQPYRLKHSNGEWRWIMAHSTIVRDLDGQATLMKGYITDVTEMKQREQARLALERQMQQAQRMESLGMLAGGVAHDFNNLLMTILGNVELGRDDAAPSSDLAFGLDEIETAARQAAELSNKMLAYTGMGHYEIGPVDLNAIIRDCLPLANHNPANTSIHVVLDPDLPRLNGDGSQLAQMVTGLLTNAVEALGPQGGTLRVQTSCVYCTAADLQATVVGQSGIQEYELAEGNWLELTVSDTGCGMDDSIRERIFEPFFSTKFTGRGLGMAAILGILRGHRSTIAVTSTPGQGTTVRVLLPLEGVRNMSRSNLPTAVDPSTSSRNPALLVVDDEQSVRRMISRMLERLGCRVTLAASGPEALRILDGGSVFDLVILDLTMPDMDGIELLGEMRKRDPDQKLLLSSGYDCRDLWLENEGLADVPFIQKPFGSEALRQMLNNLLSMEHTLTEKADAP